MNTKSTLDMTKEEWLKERKKGIGGSDVAAILGLDSYRSPHDVWEDKTSEEIIEKEPTEAMIAGTIFEPGIARLYEINTNNTVRNDNKIRYHKDYPFLLGNLDYSIVSNNGKGTGLLECKATSKYMLDKWEDEGLPQYTYCQVQHYFNITGYTWGDVAVLVDGKKLYIISIVPDEENIKLMTEQLTKFWNENVLKRIPPDAINEADIKKMFPKSDPEKTIEAVEETAKIVEDLRVLKYEIKKNEAEEEKLTEEIKIMMKDAEFLTYAGKNIVTWKQSKSSFPFNEDRFKKENFELYNSYLDEKPGSRRFLVK